ncbi:hypothetical protein HYALB_00007046 [Hymenoscyphus albidus]|uniref:Uncharacterized protein n=1 Tax=Hymenoscyphus albidus TaxID=595503 RepID=A0A9N9LLG7_9HELO|nr:hypothetical protein HYALB_00007046 [Hymenoscyphus albidus]
MPLKSRLHPELLKVQRMDRLQIPGIDGKHIPPPNRDPVEDGAELLVAVQPAEDHAVVWALRMLER